jgi:hypothetical protein
MNTDRNVIALIAVGVIILFPLVYSIAGYVFGQGDSAPRPFLAGPATEYENCVRETAYMRFHHWELLREIREEYVRHGIRGEIRLDRCRECHPNRERFCNECHDAVSLKPDCWGCHYYPERPEVTAGTNHGISPESPPDRAAVMNTGFWAK